MPSTGASEPASSTPSPGLKNWKTLRECRREGDGLHHAVPAVATLQQPRSGWVKQQVNHR